MLTRYNGITIFNLSLKKENIDSADKSRIQMDLLSKTSSGTMGWGDVWVGTKLGACPLKYQIKIPSSLNVAWYGLSKGKSKSKALTTQCQWMRY